MNRKYDSNSIEKPTNGTAYGRVTRSEVKRWEKWLHRTGYSGPFTGLKITNDCVKLLYKELKKDPPTVIETHPRDARTIASCLTKFGNRNLKLKVRSEDDHDDDLKKEILKGIRDLCIQQEMILMGIPEYLKSLMIECNTPGILICAGDYLQKRELAWFECSCEMRKAQDRTLCNNWDNCRFKNSSRTEQLQLDVYSTDAGKLRIRLPCRNRFPNFEVIFPDLVRLRIYKEICQFEELGSVWLNECFKLHMHIESQEELTVETGLRSSGKLLFEVGNHHKINSEILEPAIHAMREWDRQAELIRSWRVLLTK